MLHDEINAIEKLFDALTDSWRCRTSIAEQKKRTRSAFRFDSACDSHLAASKIQNLRNCSLFEGQIDLKHFDSGMGNSRCLIKLELF